MTRRQFRAWGLIVALALGTMTLFAPRGGGPSQVKVARALPSTTTFHRTATLSTTGQNMFGPGVTVGDRTVTIFDQGWNTSFGFNGETHKQLNVPDPTQAIPPICLGALGCTPAFADPYSGDDNLSLDGYFGASVSGHTSGDFGLSITLKGFSGATLGVDYPVSVDFTAPANDTWHPGDVITIATALTVDPTAAIHSQFPHITGLELDGKEAMHVDTTVEGCLYVCASTSPGVLALDVPSEQVKLFDLPIVPGTGCFNFLVNFPLGLSSYTPGTRCPGNAGYIDAPDVVLVSTLNGDGTISGAGTDPFAIIPVSTVAWLTRFFGLPLYVQLNPGPASVGGMTVGYTTANLVITALQSMTQNIHFTPRVDVTVAWGQSLSYEIVDASNVHVSNGTGLAATFKAGNKLKLTTPTAMNAPLHIVPSLGMGSSTTTNHTFTTTTGSGDFRLLAFELDTPSYSYTFHFGGAFSIFDFTVPLWPGTNVDTGYVYDLPFAIGSGDLDVSNSSFTLGGFNTAPLAPFDLTPNYADLTVVKTVSSPATGPVTAGTNITYGITVTNPGPSDALVTVLTDPLPANTTFVSFSPSAGCVLPAVGATGSVVCTIGTFTAGGAAKVYTMIVKLNSSTPTGSTITNTATATTSTPVFTPAHNASTTNTAVDTKTDLTVVKTVTAPASGPVTAGTSMTFGMTVTNPGPSDALLTVLTDPLPANTTFVSFSPSTGCALPAVGATGSVVCTLGTFVAGSAPRVYSLTVMAITSAPNASTITNTATTTTSTPLTVPPHNISATNTGVVAKADLQVVSNLDAPDPVVEGSQLTYTITAINNGPSDAQTVLVSVPLAFQVTFVGETHGAGWSCTMPAVGTAGTYACTRPTLAFPTGDQVFTVVTRVVPGLTLGTDPNLHTTATISSTTTDPSLGNESKTADTLVKLTTVGGIAKIANSTIGGGYKTVLNSNWNSVQMYLNLNSSYGLQAACAVLNNFKWMVAVYATIPSTGITAAMATDWRAHAELIRIDLHCFGT